MAFPDLCGAFKSAQRRSTTSIPAAASGYYLHDGAQVAATATGVFLLPAPSFAIHVPEYNKEERCG